MWFKVTARWQRSVNMHWLRLNVWLEPLGSFIHLNCQLADVQYRFPKALSIIRLMILVGQNYISKGNEHGCKPIPQQQILKVYPEAPYVGLACNYHKQSVHSDGKRFTSLSSTTCFRGNQAQCVLAGLLGLAWHLAHHQDLLQGFLDILVHLTLDSVEEVHPVDWHYLKVLLLWLS